jgi:hypothetical protein
LDILYEQGLLKDERLVRALADWTAGLQNEIERDCISGEIAVRVARVGILSVAETLARDIRSLHERPQYLRQVAESELSVGQT